METNPKEVQTLNLLDKEFKPTLLKMFKKLKVRSLLILLFISACFY